jgi:hypothetical protein
VSLSAVPLVFAALTLFHSHADPTDLGDGVTRWLTVHALQSVLSLLLAYTVWWLLDGIRHTAATVARAVLPVFLVAFAAFDAVAGLATGWLARAAAGQDGAERAATDRAIDLLFTDNWLAGSLSVAGSLTAISWLVVAVCGAVALHAAGADRLTVGLMAASALFANHPPPTGTLGLLALFAAALRWERQRVRRGAPVAAARAGG